MELSTGNVKNVLGTGITQCSIPKEDLLAKIADTISDTAHGVLGTLTGAATNALNVKKEQFTILFQEIVFTNVEDLNLSPSSPNLGLSSLNKTHVLTFVLRVGPIKKRIGNVSTLTNLTAPLLKLTQILTTSPTVKPVKLVIQLPQQAFAKMTVLMMRFTKLMSVALLALQLNTKTKTVSAKTATQSFLDAIHADTMSSMTMFTATNAQRTLIISTEKLSIQRTTSALITQQLMLSMSLTAQFQ